jgi:hypothetical protein
MSKAKFQSYKNIAIPINSELDEAVYWSNRLLAIVNSDQKIIGFCTVESVDGKPTLNINIQYDTPERLNLDNDDIYISLKFVSQSVMTVKLISGGMAVTEQRQRILSVDPIIELTLYKKS